MAVSNNIRKLRFKHGEMTQKELARLVGVSRQTMNAIETNEHAPTLDVAIRIADVFQEAVDDVFVFKYDEKPDFLIVAVSFEGSPDRIDGDRKD